MPIRLLVLIVALAVSTQAATVNYVVDAGGSNSQPLNGLAARGTFDVSGTQLTVLLENTSTGIPAGFDTASSLLVSVAFDLPAGVTIADGNAAVIGTGSQGLGAWSSRVAGDSVAEEWLWTNDFGGDLLEAYRQVISTSNGQGAGTVTRFDHGSGNVSGPYGGIAAAPALLSIPGSQPAVSNSIFFTVTLSSTLTPVQLDALANASIVEYGSDVQYLTVPEPALFAVCALAFAFIRRRG